MARYSRHAFTVTGLLTFDRALGDVLHVDGGGFWTVDLPFFRFRSIRECRVRATGVRVGFNDMAVTRLERV